MFFYVNTRIIYYILKIANNGHLKLNIYHSVTQAIIIICEI